MRISKNLIILILLLASTFLIYRHNSKTRENIRQRIDRVEEFEMQVHQIPEANQDTQEAGETPKLEPEENPSSKTSAKEEAVFSKDATNSSPSKSDLKKPQDPNQAESETACLKQPDRCFPEAFQLEQKGLLELAADSYKQYCRSENHGAACFLYIQLLEQVNKVTFDDQMEYYTMACDQRLANGCFQLASIYLETGHPRLYDHYYKAACELSPDKEFPLCPQYQ